MVSYRNYASINCEINGMNREMVISPEETLLDVLREKFGLSGSKPGCRNGDCGACTVLLDGDPVKSCMILACEVEGKSITTVEGLEFSDLQQSFIDEGGFQCGYCTSGFLVNSYAMLQAHPDADDETCEKWLESNICRCTGYQGIKRAIEKLK